MQSVNQKTDRKRSKKQTDKKMDFRVLGTVEKKMGEIDVWSWSRGCSITHEVAKFSSMKNNV